MTREGRLLPVHPARSLAVRWVIYISITVGLGIAALLAITVRQMDYQLQAEGASVMHLARLKTAERIDAELALVRQRLERMVETYEGSLANVSNLRSTLLAIQSRNDVGIAEEIGKRILMAGFNGALVLDEKLNVIGAERTGAELVASDAALKLHELHHELKGGIAKWGRASTVVSRFVGPLDPSFAAAFMAPIQDEYGIILAAPVLNDFAEPVGAIIAYRTLRKSEPLLMEFAASTRSIVVLQGVDKLVSLAGAQADMIRLSAPGPEGLRRAYDHGASARCAPSFPGLSICVLRANAEIERFGQQISVIGREYLEKTRKTLFVTGLAVLLVTMAILAVLAVRLVRPIRDITASVDKVASGEWRVHVGHTTRLDEIGRIARAVAAMQVSLAERDRMRQEMVRIDAINQRRLVLDGAVTRFEDGMAVVMKDISDTVHVLSETNDVLDRAARQADMQAERIRNTSLMTAKNTSVVSHTTKELSRTIHEISERLRNASGVVHMSESHARDAEARIGEIADVTVNVEEAILILQDTMADLSRLGLRASLDAAAAGEAGSMFAPLAGSVNLFAGKASEATRVIFNEMSRLAKVADGASGAIGEVKGVLGEALRETQEISVTLEEQGATTREIVEALSTSSSALASLTEAVDHLRENMSSAHDASADFVTTARRIAEDAKAIDQSLRSFLRDVVA
ncbi:MAG: methyl-accepting chemotaxis protein [Proteobacteria bacterium]|nr:methyl-accepting chemotaxis protein [Pseudomonadota bacterium]